MPGDCISTTPSSSIATRLATPDTRRSARSSKNLSSKLRHKLASRRALRFGLVLSNVIVLAIILAVVLQNPHSTADIKPLLSNSPAASGAVSSPLDQVSSAAIAQTVSRLTSLPETTAVTNQAQSQAADLAVASTEGNVISKPGVVATALKSRADIQNYTTHSGDTISALAAKFGVTSDSIRWSNNLSATDSLNPGLALVIPPVNGVVYTVKPGDTPDSLASQYRANRDQIVAYNDAEINGLTPGEQIIIPNAVATKVAIGSAGTGGGGFLWGNGPIYGANGYDYGYCTWYVATQIPVPSNWGNASTWAYYARLSGWKVSSSPTVGAIAQKGGGEGHVAVVIGVNPDGSVTVRDMNGFAGWGRVGTGTVSAGTFQNYITH